MGSGRRIHTRTWTPMFLGLFNRVAAEWTRIQNAKRLFMNYDYLYDDVVRAKPTVQMNAMKTTLKLVGIGNAHDGDSCWPLCFEPYVLRFRKVRR